MFEIPSDLYRSLRSILVQCAPFEDDRTLRAIFLDPRIAAWRDLVPEHTSNRTARVAALVDALVAHYNIRGENALMIFLHVLSQEVNEVDAIHQELIGLARSLKQCLPEATPECSMDWQVAATDVSTGRDLSDQILPPPAVGEIPRDGWIRDIQNGFSPECQVQTLTGPPLSGKSNILAQFARSKKGRCASYFVGSSSLSLRQHAFLYTMCYQISTILGKTTPPESITLEDLKNQFTSLCLALTQRGVEQSNKFYFVVDGLERMLEGPCGDRIIDLFPLTTAPYGPYLLASCRDSAIDGLPDSMKAHLIRTRSFDLLNTQAYLSDVGFSPEEINGLHQKYEGIPGYLQIVREEKRVNRNLDIDSIPLELNKLVQHQVEHAIESLDDTGTQLLVTLAVSPTPVALELLSEYSGLSRSALVGMTSVNTLLELGSDGAHLKCSNDVVRDSICDVLPDRAREELEALTRWVRVNHPEQEILLSLLLGASRDYEGLSETLTESSILNTIQSTGDISIVMNRSRLAADIAREEVRAADLIRWVLGVATARAFISHAVRSDEIKALLAIGRTTEALRRAYAIPDPSIKVRLLARAYSSMEERGEAVTKRSLDELQAMVAGLDRANLDREEVHHLAIDLLPVLPDAAFSLLEHNVDRDRDRSAIEVAMQAVEDRLQDPQKTEGVVDGDKLYIDRDYMPGILSSWLNGMSYVDLSRQVEAAGSPEVREYIIRQWCRQNKQAKELADAIDKWLAVVISELASPCPLRSLRHISEAVREVPCERRKELVARLRVPEFIALTAPVEEWTRFHLNLAEALAELDPQAARDEVQDVQQRVSSDSIDLDIKAYCFSRLWLAVERLFDGDDPWISNIHVEFQGALDALIRDSADHLKALLPTLRTLAAVDPMTALTVTLEVNTHQRRMHAVREVLVYALREKGDLDLVDLVDQAFALMEPERVGPTLIDVTSKLSARTSSLHQPNLDALLKHAKSLLDPADRANALSSLAGLMHMNGDNRALEVLQRSIEAWNQEPDLGVRLRLGFHMVQSASSIDLNTATMLYEAAVQLKRQPGAALAAGDLGATFRETLELAIRSLKLEDLNALDEDLGLVERLISRIPAPTVRVELFAKLAATAYRYGYAGLGDKITRTRVIYHLDRLESRVDFAQTVSRVLPVVFEYDPQAAEQLTADLPYSTRNQAWYSTVMWHLCRSYLGDHSYEPKNLQVASDHKRLKRTLRAVEHIQYDALLTSAIAATAQSVVVSFPEQLNEKEALDIVGTLEQTALDRLPEEEHNINHEGYRILAEASLNRARTSVYLRTQYKQRLSKKKIGTNWHDLIERARAIPNCADRVFCRAILAREMRQYSGGDLSALRLELESAEQQIDEIPTIVDRIDRTETVAESWSNLGEKDKTQVMIMKGAQLATQLRGLSADARLSLLVQSAYELDPDLADQLVHKLDTPQQDQLPSPTDLSLLTSRLRSDARRLGELPEAHEARGYVIDQSATKLVRDLAVGRGADYTDSVICDWLAEACTQQPGVALRTCAWAIETVRRRGSAAQGAPSANELLRIADLCLGLATWLSAARGEGIPEAVYDSFPGLSTRYQTFRPNEADIAKKWLCAWLRDSTQDYLKICDPYFGPDQLEYLIDVPISTKILIVTTDRYFDTTDGERALTAAITLRWKQMTSRVMPNACLFIVPGVGKERFHDRVIVTQGSGLDLGPSLNGLGLSYQKVGVLQAKDAKDLEADYVDDMLNTATWFMGNIHPTVLSLHP